VEQFEKGDVYFPQSGKIEFQNIKLTKRCPPLDLEYALSVLRKPTDANFARVSRFIASRIDSKLCDVLRAEGIVEGLLGATTNTDTVLLLVSTLLKENEFESFLKRGGLEMFKKSVDDVLGTSAAVSFGLKVPPALLHELRPFLPRLIEVLKIGSSSTVHQILQFLTRFGKDDLLPFLSDISTALLLFGRDVDNQPTFDAIVSLLPLCEGSFNKEQLQLLYPLTYNFVVSSAFVATLVNANDHEMRPELIHTILRATAKSDVTKDFLDLLLNSGDEVLDRVWRIPDIFTTMHDLITKGVVIAPLFLLFCLAPIRDFALVLADSPLIESLIQMKGYQVLRLQVFTVLCSFEEFCTKLKDIDGILHLLVSSLSEKSLFEKAIRLMGSLSSHSVGCQILHENGVLELFTQLFLSSSCGDVVTTQAILRNVAKFGCEIPQVSLIVSCLMQDMMSEDAKKCEIMDTVVALVQTVPGSVQEHDLNRIVMQQFNQDDPLLILLSLRLFAVCEPSVLRTIYPQLLGAVHSLLNNPLLLYPEIIEVAITVIANVAKHFDVSDFLRRAELLRYIQEVTALLTTGDARISRLDRLAKRVSARPGERTD
jgi:hypothetical protein